MYTIKMGCGQARCNAQSAWQFLIHFSRVENTSTIKTISRLRSGCLTTLLLQCPPLLLCTLATHADETMPGNK